MTTLGRMPFFAQLLRRVLVYRFIHSKKNVSYHASSGFFSIKELFSGAEKE
jgi:hypothetical protein